MKKEVDTIMMKVISECPACGKRLKITALHCSDCGLELRNDFQFSPFDSLDAEQTEFLFLFLKHRGNMSSVQGELGISYPSAKKRLDSLLMALGLKQLFIVRRGSPVKSGVILTAFLSVVINFLTMPYSALKSLM